MEQGLATGALALGVVSWVCGLLAARSQNEGAAKEKPHIALPYWAFALGAPLIFWLLTLPDAPPFGLGHASGNGALLGGFVATIGVFALLKAVNWDSESSRAAGLGMMLSLAASTSILVLLLWKQGRLDALMGVGMGWLASLFLLSLAFSSPLLTKAAAYGVTCCACLGMGVFRDAMMPGAAQGTWSGLMAVMAAGVPFVLLLCALPAEVAARKMPFPQLLPRRQENHNTARGWQMILAALLLLIMAQLLATKVADKPALLFCAGCGAVAGIIAWRVCADAEENRPSFLAPLVLLAAFIVSYRLMQGFGGGVMILAAWLPALANDQSEEDRAWQDAETAFAATPVHAFTSLLAFGAVAMLYRFAATRFRLELDTLELDEYFSFFALMLGAALPPFLARLQETKNQSPVEAALRALLCGAFLLAVPAVGMMLWGAQAALVLTAGMALGLLLVQGQNLRYAPAFFALGGALAIAQWTKHALPLYEIARDDKAKYLGAVTIALVLLLLVVDLLSRRKAA
jgi:hypothetical protein